MTPADYTKLACLGGSLACALTGLYLTGLALALTAGGLAVRDLMR
ncbi:MAG TPA: hypothetical protein VKA19_07220 [Alphaproteobacteria bacterium]|nr:hypothetical protein [Alphaproteobacteria bacterium]